jgi:type IV secretory pathway VirB4 component
MVDSKPLLKRGGGKIGWSIPSPTINFLVLGNVGSGKSVVAKMLIANIFM